jgi:hypothetical protein
VADDGRCILGGLKDTGDQARLIDPKKLSTFPQRNKGLLKTLLASTHLPTPLKIHGFDMAHRGNKIRELIRVLAVQTPGS